MPYEIQHRICLDIHFTGQNGDAFDEIRKNALKRTKYAPGKPIQLLDVDRKSKIAPKEYAQLTLISKNVFTGIIHDIEGMFSTGVNVDATVTGTELRRLRKHQDFYVVASTNLKTREPWLSPRSLDKYNKLLK